MKTEKEILDAHDLLEDVLDRKITGMSDLEISGREKMNIVRMTLCWILGHAKGQPVEDRLQATRAYIAKQHAKNLKRN